MGRPRAEGVPDYKEIAQAVISQVRQPLFYFPVPILYHNITLRISLPVVGRYWLSSVFLGLKKLYSDIQIGARSSVPVLS